MADNEEFNPADPFKQLEPHLSDVKIAPAHGIAAIALSLAMKYHDIATIKDGAMYQQYKLEGRNIREINLDTVFETAIRIEMHLLASSERIAKIVVDVIAELPEEEFPHD
jgi:hypothetical protein